MGDLKNIEVKIEQLGKAHKCEGFSCGDDALDRYLKIQASQDQRRKISAVLIAVDVTSSELIGYYTLSSAEIGIEKIPESQAKKLPKYRKLPATRLGRLAVDTRYQRMGWGEHLLKDALIRSFKSEIASWAVLVDAKDDIAKSFYLKYGFLQFRDEPLTLFLPMTVIEKMFI